MGWFVRKFEGGIRCLKENGLSYTVCHLWNKCRNQLSKIGIKILEKINKIFRKISSALNFGFVEIINVRMYVKDDRFGRVYFVFLFGKQIYPAKRHHRTNTWVDPNQPVMYFKINRMSDYAKPCIQHWVNVAYQLKADYYFICDNKQLEHYVLASVIFPGPDIKFMPSDRKGLKKIGETITTKLWWNATYAHLTPIYHAKEKNIKKFWAIDADDTMICLSCGRTAEILKEVQYVADKDSMTAISLDMWRSRTFGNHWSWGVAYLNDNVDFCSIFANIKDLSWTANYRHLDINFSMDWFFTYLKDSLKIKINTFYVENMQFIHWGNFLRFPFGSGIFYWQAGKVIFPIFRDILGNERFGVIDIADCLRITPKKQITLEEGMKFLENEVTLVRMINGNTRKLYQVGNYALRKNTIENL